MSNHPGRSLVIDSEMELQQCPRDGIEKGRQEIADPNFSHVQQIEGDGDNEEAPGACNGTQNGGFLEEGQLGGEQRDCALYQKNTNGGKENPYSQSGSKGDGGYAVEHGLNVESSGVSRCSILNGTDNDHGTRAIEKGSRHEPVHEGGGVGPSPLLQPAADFLQIVFDP